MAKHVDKENIVFGASLNFSNQFTLVGREKTRSIYIRRNTYYLRNLREIKNLSSYVFVIIAMLSLELVP